MKVIHASTPGTTTTPEPAGMQPLAPDESGSVTGGDLGMSCIWCLGCWTGAHIGGVLLRPL